MIIRRPFQALAFRLLAAIAAGLIALAPPVAAAPSAQRSGAIRSVQGCTVRYTVHMPAQARPAPVILLAHGFMRGEGEMRGWAEALADRGLVAATVEFCAPTWFDGRHSDNARDFAAVRRALGAATAIYVGHSAGGLAALLAAAEDDATRGVLLLDPVEWRGRGRRGAVAVRAPAAALVAPPGTCNVVRNADRALAMLPGVTVLEFPGATHCDFEWPTDWLCKAGCGVNLDTAQREAVRARMREVALGFAEAVAAGTPDALADWRRRASATVASLPADAIADSVRYPR